MIDPREATLPKLRHAVILSATRSYSVAASQLNMSQPALTRSIQSLEAEIGIQLFERSRSGVQITEAGEVYLDQARSLLSDSRNLSALALELATGSTGEIAFGLAPIPARILLPDLALQIVRERPGVSLGISVQTAAKLLNDLIDERISFFVSSATLIEQDVPLDHYTIAHAAGALVVRNGHPLTEPGARPDDVFAFPIVSQSTSEPKVRAMVAAASSLIHCDDIITVKAMVEHSDAVWLATPHVAPAEIAAGTLIELSGAVTEGLGSFPLNLYRLRRRKPSRLSGHVETLVRTTLRRKLR